MGLKEQWTKIKENWLMIVLVLLILGAFLVVSKAVDTNFTSGYGGVYMEKALSSYNGVSEARMIAPYPSDSFAPGVTERELLKSANLNSEIKQGEFLTAESKLKAIITSSGAYLLDENVQKYGEEDEVYHAGYYNLKVDTKKYAAVVSQLKEIGTIISFSENTQDVTGSYTNLKVELQAEQERLARYEKMFSEATEVSDKITLNDRIFDEQRTIKYLQERLQNIDTEVEYSSIYVSLQEKPSPYANVEVISFSALVMAFVGSLNGLFELLVVILPYGVAIVIILVVYKVARRKKK